MIVSQTRVARLLSPGMKPNKDNVDWNKILGGLEKAVNTGTKIVNTAKSIKNSATQNAPDNTVIRDGNGNLVRIPPGARTDAAGNVFNAQGILIDKAPIKSLAFNPFVIIGVFAAIALVLYFVRRKK